MIVTLDDFEIGSVTNKYDITEIDGLGPTDIRTSQFNFSGRDGGLVTDQFFGMRLISISGVIRSNTCDSHIDDRSDLEEASPIDTIIPVYITLFNGVTYLIYANVTKLSIEYRPGGKYSDFKLDLLAGDPLFYSTDGGSSQSANLDKSSQGGYVTPYDLPVDWALGGQPTTVLNSGNAIAYPIITLTDSAVNPIITNQTTGEAFALDMSMLDGDVVIINMRERTVTLNGSNIIGNKTDDSIWWGLAIGNNNILLDTDTGSDNVSAVITWQNGRTGI